MLVVLPFSNLDSAEDGYFADGITDEITNRLATLHRLGVISRTSAFQYRNTSKTIRQIADELEVDYVLEGCVSWNRSSPGKGRIRVISQLVRVTDDTQVWEENYDRVIDRAGDPRFHAASGRAYAYLAVEGKQLRKEVLQRGFTLCPKMQPKAPSIF